MHAKGVHTFGPVSSHFGDRTVSEWDDEPRPRRRHKKHKRKRRRREREDLDLDEALLTDEERRLRKAERRADEKLKLTGEVIRFSIIVAVATLVAWPLGILVAFFFGRGLFRRYYRLVIEPRMRERYVHEEVQKQVEAELTKERRALEGEHARSLEHLSASIAHEIRNPVTAAKSLVQQMGEDPKGNENVEYARVALEELHRVEKSVSHLLRFARDEEMQLGEVRLADVVDSALETFRDRVARQGATLEREFDGEGPIRGDAEKLRRVVINLVGNSLDALEEAGTEAPRIDVALGENLAGTEVWLRVRDNGPGIDAEAQQKMFSPFFTSKANGTGLGLAITKKLVEAHQGQIEVTSEPGQGAEFVLTFAKAREPVPEAPGEGGPEA